MLTRPDPYERVGILRLVLVRSPNFYFQGTELMLAQTLTKRVV